MMDRWKLVLVVLLAAACKGNPAPRLAVVDTVLPRSEALAQFQSRFPEVSVLNGGSASRETLAEHFVQALARSDSAEISQMVLSPAEFGWLYYPTTRVSLPPYDLAPDLLWFQIDGQSRKGIGAALQSLGNRPLAYRGLDCPATPTVEGKNQIWSHCTVRFQVGNEAERTARLFGPIIGRDGVFKLVGLANSLD